MLIFRKFCRAFASQWKLSAAHLPSCTAYYYPTMATPNKDVSVVYKQVLAITTVMVVFGKHDSLYTTAAASAAVSIATATTNY